MHFYSERCKSSDPILTYVDFLGGVKVVSFGLLGANLKILIKPTVSASIVSAASLSAKLNAALTANAELKAIAEANQVLSVKGRHIIGAIQKVCHSEK